MACEKFVRHILTGWFDLVEVLSLEPTKLWSHDRVILEDIILPYFGRSREYQKVLFVGCAAYTQWYEKFFSEQEYWTIDQKKIKRKYGSANHIADSIVNLERHLPKNYFNCIIMNGIIGYGLNNVADTESGLRVCFNMLDTQGILVLGWNDSRWRKPVEIGEIQALKKFKEYYFDPLQTCHYRTEASAGHVFSFYRKE